MSKNGPPKKKNVVKKSGTEAEALVAATIERIEKEHGKGTVMKLGAGAIIEDLEVISTGSIGLDIALGVKGCPRGRIVEVFGPESSGKTTLALHIVANAQKAGGICAYVDAEHALDMNYAKNLGVNVEELLLSQPDYGEQALEVVDSFVAGGGASVVVIDSVAALTPKKELEGDMGDSHMGLQARLMSQAMRKLTANVARSNTLVVFINQIRKKIGVMFGSPDTTSGGNALKFYSTIRLEIKRIGAIKKGADSEIEVLGNRTRVKVVKNKVSPPLRVVDFDLIYGKGISTEGELIDMGVAAKLVEKSGAWYSVDKERIGQGRENAKQFLIDNPTVAEKLKKSILEL